MQRLAGVEPLVGHSGVVGRSPGRGAAKFFEHDGRVAREAVRWLTEPLRQVRQDVEFAARSVRAAKCSAPAQDSALQRRHGALLLRPLERRQHHVGAGSGLGEDEIRHHQQLEGVEPVDDVRRPGCGDGEVRSVHQQRAGPVGTAQGVEQFVRTLPRTRDVGRVDTPHTRDVLAGRGIGDGSVAG